MAVAANQRIQPISFIDYGHSSSMHDGPLADLAGTTEVENVVLFISDALRFDFLPAAVREKGVTAKAIAPSTFTASSLPSLLTGQYPASHNVWMFDDQLPERPRLVEADRGNVGFDASTVWIELESHEKPPLQIHKLETESMLADLDPPFTHVVHDVGPHAPYGFENGVFESTREFFSEYENERARLVELYRRDCERSAERFLDLYEQLVDRDLLDSTLLVFTSDHGQALGERRNGGRFGHGHPMSPELVDIPVVFLGAGLPEGVAYPTLLSGTDIAPTLVSAQRNGRLHDADGIDLWRTDPPTQRKLRSDVWQNLNPNMSGRAVGLSVYAATSVWNDHGGYTFHRKSRMQRAGSLAYDNLFRGYAPAWRHNSSIGDVVAMARIVLASTLSFGAPDFTVSEARTVTPGPFSKASSTRDDVDLSDEQQEQLRDLGYLQ